MVAKLPTNKRAMMKTISMSLFLWIVTLLLVACQGNSFYIQEGTQLIRRCGGGTIRRITVEDSLELTFVECRGSAECSSQLDLENIGTDYAISRGEDTLTDNRLFSLKPRTKYVIAHHTVGDATGVRITIMTDTNGKISYASQTSCD